MLKYVYLSLLRFPCRFLDRSAFFTAIMRDCHSRSQVTNSLVIVTDIGPEDWIKFIIRVLDLIFGKNVPPWALKTIGYLSLFALILLACWGVLSIISKIKLLWSEQFSPMFYKPQEVRRRELRRRFADHVESEIRRLNNLEQWSDHRFAELEAEVQAEGKSRWTSALSLLSTRECSSIRQERSLSEALANSRERLILLEGEPGAGKSVALRHVAQTI
jgi:hypothetical protein